MMYVVETYDGQWISVRPVGLQEILRKYYVTRVTWIGYASCIRRNM